MVDSKQRAGQFTIREVLLVTTLTAVVLAAWRAFGGGIGLFELVLASIMGLSILLAALLPRWPAVWFAGLCLCMLAIWVLVPAPRDVKSMAAAAFGGSYAILGGPLLLICRTRARRWPWIVGAAACVYASAVFTPADPASAMLALWPLGVLYASAAFVRLRRQQRAATTGN